MTTLADDTTSRSAIASESSIDRLRREVTRLAEIRKPSASYGERQAARVIAQTMRQAGAKVTVDSERAHGNYTTPMIALTGSGVVAGALGRRKSPLARTAAATLGALAAAGIWDDLTAGRHWFRGMLPTRATRNIIAQFGPADAPTTLVMVAHYDAAKSGHVFDPRIPQVLSPDLLERRDPSRELGSPPVMFPVLAGPAIAAAGALAGSKRLAGLGALVSAGAAAVFTDIATSDVVPGANDNISGVVCLQEAARRLAEDLPDGLRLMFVFTGSEESFMEGMRAFADRHFPDLRQDRTFVLCVDTVGSDRLLVLRGEGMLKLYRYPQKALALMDSIAADLGVRLEPKVLLRNATDGLYALKAGYPSAMLGSVSANGAPGNYHWPTDTPQNVNYDTIEDAVRICIELAQRVADGRDLGVGDFPG